MRIPSAMLLMALAIALSHVDTATGDPAAPDSFEAALRSQVSARSRHGLPYKVATSFGPRAVPILTKWLADDSMTPHYPEILSFLGYLGGPKETKLIEGFLLNRYEGEIDQTQLDGLIAAIYALGCISDRDPTALKFLETATDPAFFSETRYENSLRGRAGLHLLLSKLAVNAFGLSSRPEAERALRRLEKAPKHPDQTVNISDALKSHSKLVRIGREEFASGRRQK